MNDHKYSSTQLPFCHTLKVGVNCHGGHQFPSTSSSSSNNTNTTKKLQPLKKYLIQDVRDQINHQRNNNSFSSSSAQNVTHLVVKRNLKQSLVLQSISIDSDDLKNYFSSDNKNNKNEDFTITIYCQRAPILCEGIKGDAPIALCTLKPSAGLVNHNFEQKAFHPLNGSIEFKSSVNIFAIVKRSVNVSVFKKKNNSNDSRRRQREEENNNDDEVQEQNLTRNKLAFKINILGYISQPVEKLAALQAWKRLDELSARHALFEDDPSMRGHISDDFSRLRDSLQKKLYSYDADGQEDDSSDDEELSNNFDDDDDDDGFGGGRSNNFDNDDDDDDESDEDVRNLRDILNSDDDDDGSASSSGSGTIVSSSNESLVHSEDLEENENGPDQSDDEEDHEDFDDDIEGWDEDENNDDEEDEEDDNDIYFNETRPRAWRYSQRR